jgi:transposase
MAKPYSNDLRTRVAKAIASGETIAAQYELAPSTVVKWSKRLTEAGSAEPAKFDGHKRCSLEPHRDFVLAQIEEVPHLTLHKLKDMLADRGIAVSHDTVWRVLKRAGHSFKKRPHSPVSSSAPTLPGAADAGCKSCLTSTRSASSSSLGRGSRPTWRRCAGGGRAVSG